MTCLIPRLSLSALFIGLLFSGNMLLSQDGLPGAGFQKSANLRIWQNKGQVRDQHDKPRPDVYYLAEAAEINVQFKRSGISYDIFKRIPAPLATSADTNDLIDCRRIDIEFSGSNQHVAIEHSGPSADYNNYVLRGDWEVREVRSYDRIVYRNVYRNIDFVFYARSEGADTGDEQALKFDIVVRPGGDIADVRLKVSGVDRLYLHESGALKYEAGDRTLTETIPTSYLQPVEGNQPSEQVSCRYRVDGDIVSFIADNPPQGFQLVVDPQIVWGTYYGGGSMDRGYEFSWTSGSEYVFSGRTESNSGIASSGAYQSTRAGNHDGYFAKFNINGVRQWGTYYGTSAKEAAHAIDVAPGGEIYLAGETESYSGLSTPGAAQTLGGGGRDAFLAKFDGSGFLQWSTYLGGGSSEEAFGVVATSSVVVITGRTESTNFPATGGAYQTVLGGSDDCFIAAYSPNGTKQWATYYGGSGTDRGLAIELLASGNVVIVGESSSGSGMTTAGAFQPANGGGFDGLICTFSLNGQRVWSSYYGGGGTEVIRDVAVSGTDLVFIGTTNGGANIATPGTHQTVPGGSSDAMLAMFNQGGTRIWGTYYGGPSSDHGFGVEIQSSKIWVTGETYSATGIASPGSHQPVRNGASDMFMADFTTTGNLICGTYFGGSGGEIGYDIIMVAPSQAILTGETNSTTDISTPTGHQPIYSGGLDAVLARLISVCGGTFFVYYSNRYLCVGESVKLTGNVTGGFPPYTYLWSPATGLSATNIPDPIASPLVTTTYIVQVTDANNNTTRDTLTVFVNPSPVADAGPDTTICANAIATLHGSASGGTPPYSASWSPAAGLSNPSSFTTDAAPTTTTTYILTVTDANGCMHSDTVTVFVRHPLDVDAGPDRLLCAGKSVQLTATAPNALQPVTWKWTPATGLSDPNAPITVASPTQTTAYVVQATDSNGCTGYDTVVVTINSLTADAGPDQIICSGSPALLYGSVTGGTPPISIQWIPPATLSNPKSLNTTASPTVTTKYYLQVADSTGCIAIDSVMVFVRDPLDVDAGPDALVCAGGSTQLLASVTGAIPPVTWQWTPPAGLSDPASQSPICAATVTTTYIVTATDSSGCTGKDTVVVTVGNSLLVDAGPDVILCGGGSATIGRAASGGTAPYTYQWSPQNGLSNPSALNTEARPAQTTAYILYVVDANGCAGRDTVTGTITEGMAVDAGPDVVLCFGQSAVIGNFPTVGAPPFTILWTPPTGLSNPTVARPVASPTVTTTYVMSVTDKNGCVGTDTVVVTVGMELIATAGPDKRYCKGGSAILEGGAAGGIPPYTYSWTPGIAISSRTVARPTANPLDSQQYILCVTDSLGCSDCDTVNVFVGDKLAVDAGRDRYLCSDGSVLLNARINGGSSPFTFVWTPANGLSNTNSGTTSAKPSQTTTYIVTATDQNGCTGSDTVTVFVNEPIAFDAGPDGTICRGDTVDIGREAGYGNAPYSYSWQPPLGLSDTSAAVVSASPGTTTTYIVTVRDADGCMATDTIKVTVNTPPVVDATGENIICAGDTTQLHATATGGTPPYTYEWRPPVHLSDPSSSDPLAWPPVTTLYTVRVTGADGCSAEDTVLVTVRGLPNVDIAPGGVITLCEGDSIALNATGGQYRYEWSTGDTTVSIVVKRGGVYRVRVTNEAGCTAVSQDVTVNMLPGLMPEIIGPIVLCKRDSIVYRVVPPNMDSYQWTVIGGTLLSGAGTDRIIVSWNPETVTGILEVIVGHGPCLGRDTLEVAILEKLHPGLTLDGNLILCNGSSVLLQAQQGYARYRWSTGDTSVSIIANRAGEYYVWVEDTLGCGGYSDTIRVTESKFPVIEITGGLVLCGPSETTLAAGDGFLSYAWSTGDTSSAIRVAAAGKYSVFAVDSNGCTSFDEVTVTQGPGMKPEIEGDTVLCSGETGTLSVVGDYAAYRWSTGDTTKSIAISQAGMYIVRVYDMSGCAGEDTILVHDIPRTDITVAVENIQGDPGERVFIRLVITAPEYTTLGQMSYTGILSFERTVLHPVAHAYEDRGGMRYIAFSGMYNGGTRVVLEIECMALLGQTDTTTIYLNEFAWGIPCAVTHYAGGMAAINICREGGNRLVTTIPKDVVASVSPNPFTDQTQIALTVRRGMHIKLQVKDAMGRLVATLIDAYTEPGDYTALFDAAGLPSGTYFYVLETGAGVTTGSMMRVK